MDSQSEVRGNEDVEGSEVRDDGVEDMDISDVNATFQ